MPACAIAAISTATRCSRSPRVVTARCCAFGNDDRNPDVEQVNQIEAELKKRGKKYEFHRYDGAGHGFFNTAGINYRPEQVVDGWKQVFAFYERYLKTS